MSRQLSRRELLVAAAACTVGVLAGCRPAPLPEAPGEATKEATKPPAPVAAPAKKKVVLSVWGAVQEDVLYKDVYIPKYQELHPDVQIDFLSVPDFDNYYDKLVQLHAAGTPVDVQRHNSHRLGLSLGQGMVMELSALYDRDKVDIDDVLQGVMPVITREGGKIYAIPQDENLYGLLYNPALFDEAGLPYPDDKYTFDQMLEDAGKLTKKDSSGNVTQWGFMSWWNSWNLWGFILGYGGKIWENPRTPQERVVVDEGWYQALGLWKKIMIDFELTPAQEMAGNLGANVFFEQKRAAMLVDGTWRQPFVKKAAPDLDFAMTSFPKGTVKKSRASSCAWGISTGTKELETAWDLAKYLYTPEAQVAYWQILWVAPPARLSVVKSPDFKQVTGMTAGGIEYPGLADEAEFERKCRWIVTTLENGWDTQEFVSDSTHILSRELDAAIQAVLVPGSKLDVREAIDTAVANTNKEIELNRG
jgi:multiple sugar transport system substrate-binding protein